MKKDYNLNKAIMKTYFKDVYWPVKNGITGELLTEQHSKDGELYQSIVVTKKYFNKLDKMSINATFFFKGQYKSFVYGTTIKEIKALVNDINDFKYDPYLFLNL